VASILCALVAGGDYVFFLAGSDSRTVRAHVRQRQLVSAGVTVRYSRRPRSLIARKRRNQ